jgi:NADPH2:quinone reductase
MQAWLLDSLSGLNALRLAQVPDPVRKPGEAILAIAFAALNPADRYLSEGQYPARPPLPHILGRDGLGVVIEAGAETGLTVGRKMIVLRGPAGVTLPGTFAEKLAVPAEYLVDVPAGWSDQEAAGAPLVYLTAYQALKLWPDLPASAVVVVTGASGGVGVASVQLAAAMGHTVVALSRDPAKHRHLLALGAKHAFDGSRQEWPDDCQRALGGRRVDLVIDNIGGQPFTNVLQCLGDKGRVSCVGRLAGPVPQFNTASLFFRRIKLGGVSVGAYTSAESRAAWVEIVSLLSSAGRRPLVDGVFPFPQLKEAFAHLAHGPMGKVLLAVHPDLASAGSDGK